MIPRIPQENSVSRSVHDIACKVHLQFWANAIDNYLINKKPLSALDDGILEEGWIGVIVNYYYHKTSGCEDFMYIDKENRKKLDTKYNKCIFIRYRVNDLGYNWFWDCEIYKIINSRDMVFNEKSMYKDRLEEKKEDSNYIVLDEINEKDIPKVHGNLQH